MISDNQGRNDQPETPERQRRRLMGQDAQWADARRKEGRPLPSFPVLRTTLWSVIMLLEAFHEGLYHGKSTHELQQHAGKLAALLEFDLKGTFGADPLGNTVGILLTVRPYVPHDVVLHEADETATCPACLLDRFFQSPAIPEPAIEHPKKGEKSA